MPPHAEAESRPWARPIILWLARRCLGWNFRHWRIIRLGEVPPTGPVLLIGNHPNDLPDILLGFFTTRRHVRYIATISAAANPVALATYRGLGVIPVARIRDARKLRARQVDAVALNRAANASVIAALHAGEVVGVFPEGGVVDSPALGSMRVGVAGMVLEYLDADSNHDVTMVPFGVQYEAPNHRGSDAWAVVGAPYSLKEWRAGALNGKATATQLSERFRDALLSVTRSSPTWEEATRRDEIVAALAAQERPDDPVAGTVALVQPVQQLLDGLQPATELREAAHRVADAVRTAGGMGTSATDHARLRHALGLPTGSAPRSLPVLLLGAVPAFVGALLHAPAWMALQWWGRKHAAYRTDIPARFMVPGLYWVVGWWVLLTMLIAWLLPFAGESPWWALGAMLLMPRLGDCAIAWGRAWQGVRFVSRIRGWERPCKDAVAVEMERMHAAWEANARTAETT
jgi:hypothetical protein